MARSRLRIPDSHQSVLAELVSLPDDEFVRLARALREVPAGATERAFAMGVADRLGLDADKVFETVRLLGMLFRLREAMELDREEFLAEVQVASENTGHADLMSPKVDWQKARSRTDSLLDGTATLGLTSKAADLLAEHSKVLCTSRVLTDLRPIFGSDVTAEPTAILVVHKLRLGYHENGELHHTYFAMDADDIAELQAALDRAVKKAASLTEMAKRTQVRVLEAVTHSD